MKKVTIETDYSVGIHTWIDREMHRTLPPWEVCATGAQLKERQQIYDEIFRKNYKNGNTIVVCEVCEEHLAESILRGERPFEKPAIVSDMLESLRRSPIAARVARIAAAFVHS